MSVCIVIPVLNNKKVVNTIQAFSHMQYDEMIIVDNGSTDGTFEELVKMESADRRLKVLQCKKRGSYVCRNLGAKESKADILIFTDSDCIPKAGLIDAHAVYLRKYAYAGGDIIPSTSGTVYSEYCRSLHPVRYSSHHGLFMTSNFSIQRKVLEDAGGFEEIPSGGDFALCKKLRKMGHRGVFIPDAIVKHEYPQSITDLMGRQFRYGYWNRTGSINLPGALQVLREHGLVFFSYRVIQDLSYKVGQVFGFLKRS